MPTRLAESPADDSAPVKFIRSYGLAEIAGSNVNASSPPPPSSVSVLALTIATPAAAVERDISGGVDREAVAQDRSDVDELVTAGVGVGVNDERRRGTEVFVRQRASVVLTPNTPSSFPRRRYG